MAIAPLDWREIDEVFQAAIGLHAAERARLIAERCAGRPDVEREVASLLQAHDASTGFLEPPATGVSAPAAAAGLGVGARIGPYELTRLLGYGGMGTVYAGVRADGTFDQRVAIKLTRAVLDVDVARRFAAERQILASLQHPHIVTLFDGGTTPTGQAFLVMEYVDGPSILEYADQQRLSLPARLALFRDVCAAVHAAHQHGIVHRDLKPANILVGTEGVVKVLDFGIAKLVDSASADPAATRGLAAPLTPNYASPEQLRGQPVTIASDVYALGVLLFELLTGRRPHERDDQPIEAVLAGLRDERTPRLCAAAGRVGGAPYDASALRGDLEAVVAKAMRVDAQHRYGSADALSDDIARVLAGHPVVAREPTFGYLVAKMVGRHRAAFAAGVIAILAIIAALGVAVWQRQRAEQARAQAQAHFDDVRKLANALIFKLDETVRRKSPTEARQVIVTEALGYLDRLAASSDDPRLRFELAEGYQRIGEVQGHPAFPNLGDRSGALASFDRALALVQPLEADPRYRAPALASMVGTHRLQAALQPDRASAGQSARAAVAAAERWVAIERSDAARRGLGSALFALASNVGWPEGRVHWEAAGREFESLLAERPDDPDRMRNVALVDKYLSTQLANGEPDESRRRAERAAQLDGRRLELLPTSRQAMVDAAISYAQLAVQLSDARERLALYEKSLDLRERVTAADPADQFAREVHRRALIQVAATRLDLDDPRGARDAAERAAALFDREEPGLVDRDDLYWRARASLLVAVLDARDRRTAAGCRRLAAGAADVARLTAAKRRVPTTEFQAAQRALPGCPPSASAGGL